MTTGPASLLPVHPLPADDDTSGAPLSLTASDGTGLRLVSMKARAVVQEPLSLTQLHLVFDNPQDRQLEGRFSIDLPEGAALSRLAMKIEGSWQEGEVVERQAARRIYEDFLHKRRDPALLEKEAGNRFSARVFPIPALGRKEIIIAYSQELVDGHDGYRLPLRGLPKLDELDARVVVERGDSEAPRIEALHETDYEPREDLEVDLLDRGNPLGVRAGDLAVARVNVQGPELSETDGLPMTILFDTSASQANGFASKVRKLGALVRALDARAGNLRLRIVAFDQAPTVVFDNYVDRFDDWVLQTLHSRRALGASNLEAALRSLPLHEPLGGRVVLMTDGVATVGARESAALSRAVTSLYKHEFVRLDAIVDGPMADPKALASLTIGHLGYDGVVVDGGRDTATIVDALRRDTLSGIDVTVEGASWSWPRTLDGVQPGDEVLVYARLPEDRQMRVALEGDWVIEPHIELARVDAPLLQRAVAGAKISALQARLSEIPEDAVDERKRWRDEIVSLSTRHRVVSDFTALLVLETEADYARYQIDRNALTDILTVEGDAIGVLRRSLTGAGDDIPHAPGEAVPMMARSFDPGLVQDSAHFLASPYGSAFAVANADEDVWGGITGTELGEAYGVGGLGIIGTGGGGGGTGSATGRSGGGYRHTATTRARVRMGKAEVGEGLDRDIVRRIVRAHINEVRHCYSRLLRRRPTLDGHLRIDFTVGPRGRVADARVRDRRGLSRGLAKCVTKAVERWKFPKPDRGASVGVRYPFVFTPQRPPSAAELAAREARWIAEEQRSHARAVATETARAEGERTEGSPYIGRRFDLERTLRDDGLDAAFSEALAWVDEEPGNVVALVALGEFAARKGLTHDAARAFGSVVDLFPSQVEMLRHAGARLSALDEVDRHLVVDVFRQAVQQRPGHPSGHRFLAYAQLRADEPEAAFDTLLHASSRVWDERFHGVAQIFEEDLGIVAAAWLRARPYDQLPIRLKLAAARVKPTTFASTRFVMSWETDANDVDFHVYDGEAGHAFYGDKDLSSGGRLFADIVRGYGPECFRIEGDASAFPYTFKAHYYARGPMGYGMGTLQILQHDGEGGLAFDERPFIIMKDRADLDLGQLTGRLPTPR